jgi:TolA-binding protein
MSYDQMRQRFRVTVKEAARLTGLSENAIRGRIKRDTIAHERTPRGEVYVVLNADQVRQDTDQSNDRPSDKSELVEELRDQVRYLRGQLDQERDANRENRRIIAGLTQRIPELEAASSSEQPPEASQTVEEGPDRAEPRFAAGGTQGATQRPWWRRVFGG